MGMETGPRGPRGRLSNRRSREVWDNQLKHGSLEAPGAVGGELLVLATVVVDRELRENPGMILDTGGLGRPQQETCVELVRAGRILVELGVIPSLFRGETLAASRDLEIARVDGADAPADRNWNWEWNGT